MNSPLTRRRLLAAAPAAAIAHAASTAGDKPALLGGPKVRNEAFPAWPRFDEREERGLLDVLRSGRWGRGQGQLVQRFEAAYAQLTDKSKAEVAGAQFNALQFGRVGAPRNWQGDKGQSGAVTVGPYVRVNLIDCRDFTNTITISGQAFVKKGTACREADGHWSLSAQTKTG